MQGGRGPEVEAFLRGLPLFRGCDPSLVTKLSPHIEVIDCAPKQTIARAGAPSDGLWIVQRGRVSVASMNVASGAATTIDTLHAGDYSGELGAVLGGANPYSLIAEEASTVLRMRPDIVEQLLSRVAPFAAALAKRLAMRVVQLDLTSMRKSDPTTQPTAAASPVSIAPEGVVPFVDTADYELTPKVVQLLPDRMIQQHRVIPLALKGQSLTLGMVSPKNAASLAEIRRFLQNLRIEPVAIGLEDYAQALVRLKLHARADARGAGINPDALQFDQQDAEREAEKAARVIGDEVIRAVNRIVAAALERAASDVHIEQEVTGLRVRFRVNGLVQDWSEIIPTSLARGVVARFKILAGLDITERRLPQDGRISLTLGRREIDMRISTMPISRGEKIVLRVAEASSMSRPIDQTIVDAATQRDVKAALQRPNGAILVVGSTGSGKTSTLYAMLGERRKLRPIVSSDCRSRSPARSSKSCSVGARRGTRPPSCTIDLRATSRNAANRVARETS